MDHFFESKKTESNEPSVKMKIFLVDFLCFWVKNV